jgi:plastocyanin
MKKLMAVGVLALVFASSLALLGCGSNNSSTPAAGTTTAANTVSIKNFSFIPSNLTVNVGDTVTWVNNDSTNHTVTGDNSGTNDDFDSGILAPGDSWSHTFNAVGSQPYHCTIHTSMHATVTVQGQSSGGNSGGGGTGGS